MYIIHKFIQTKLGLVIVLLLLFNFGVKAQFPSPIHHDMRLALDTNSKTVIYDLNSVKFYFKREVLLKYLKNKLNESVYKEFAARGEIDSNYMALFNALKMYPNNTFYIKQDCVILKTRAGKIEKTMLENCYKVGLNQILPYVLIKSDFALFDKKRNTFVENVRINQDQTYDFKGWRQVLTLFYTDGGFLFSIQNRKTPEGNDLPETF